MEAVETESSLGDISRVTDISWHCSKVSEARIYPRGVVAWVTQRVSKEKAVMTHGKGSLGVATLGLSCLSQDGYDGTAPAGPHEPEVHLGDGHLASFWFPTPSSLQHPARLERPCRSHSLKDPTSTTAGQRQHA